MNRKSKHLSKVETKKRINSIYKILDELDKVAQKLIDHDENVTENNVETIASNYTDLKIGSFEKMLILSKLNDKKK